MYVFFFIENFYIFTYICFITKEFAKNKLPTSEGFRMCSIDPNETKFELQIIQMIHLTFIKKITLPKLKHKNLPIEGTVLHIKHLICFVNNIKKVKLVNKNAKSATRFFIQ